ncbi:hypothetical protein G7Y79_00020g049330 [Physcia stellaris]|nr:hypothetical protein G7Y79_00020g049330 [Physcia stellaris]
MFASIWQSITLTKTANQPSYELLNMSFDNEPASDEPDKNRTLVVQHEDGRSSLSSDEDAQAGVKNIEIISQTWTTWALIAAYAGVYLLAFVTSLEGQTTVNLSVYATSSFLQHSLVATIYVVQQVVNAVIKPPMAKVANVFGRLEAFSLSILIFVVGYIQQAASKNVQTFAAAQIFYSAGGTGLQILIQIFIADTSDLLNRALFSSIPDIPFLITVWIGSPIAQSIYKASGWRWGYGLWAIVLPIAFLPLLISLVVNMQKAKKLHALPPSPWKGKTLLDSLKTLWFELDVFGEERVEEWKYSFYAGYRIPVFYTSIQPYFYSYLQVVHHQSITAAGHITQTFSFTSTVSSIVIGFVIKYTHHYKYYITTGACIYLLGIGLLIKYRTESSSIGSIVGTQIAVGIGGGLINVPAQLGVQASVSHGDVAAATAIFLTIVEIGGAVGAAISGAVWTAKLPEKLALYLPEANKADAALIFGNLTLAQSFARGTPEGIAISRAYQETMNTLLIIAACFCIPMLPLSLLMRNYRLGERQRFLEFEAAKIDKKRY